MYTLRTIVKNVQLNKSLGEDYAVIERETNYEEFAKTFKTCFQTEHVADDDKESTRFTQNCYAFIVHNEGSAIIPLYKNQSVYVMTESGKTFSNLSYKK